MRETGGCGDGQLSGSGNLRTGYELLTGSQPDRYGRQDLASFPTKPVLYIHGTKDDNLDWPGEPGCWRGGPPVDANDCTLDEDPLYSMDYGGPLEQRDDISSVNWLLNRHQLAPDPVSDCIVLDADPGNNDSDADLSNTDKVTTHRYEYHASRSSPRPVVAQPVTWYEMQGAGHDVSTLNQVAGNSNSTDFEASLHTKTFFEDRAGMLTGPQSSTTTAATVAFACTLQAPW